MAMYTGTATATGGRNGHVETDDGLLKFDLSIPSSMGGPGRSGTTNPEQLFAAGYAACFGSALDVAAKKHRVAADRASVTCAASIDKNDGGFFLAVTLRVAMPGVDRAQAEEIVREAHTICPYSKATRGNIEVALEVA
jgi:osmotically inducible protein OsmC